MAKNDTPAMEKSFCGGDDYINCRDSGNLELLLQTPSFGACLRREDGIQAP